MEQLANMPMWAQVFSMGSFMFASGVLLLRLPLLPTLILSFIYLLNIFGAGTTMPSFTFKSPWIWTIGHAVLLIPLGFVFICIAANSSSSSKSAEMWNSAFFYLFFIGMLVITIIPAIYKLVILFKELPFGAGVTAVCVFFLILGLAVSIKFFKPMAAEGGILFGFFIPTIFAAVICVIALAGIFTRSNILCFITMAVCMILLYITSIMSGASRPAAVPPLIQAVEKNNPQKIKTILASSKISSKDITDAFTKAVELGNAQIVKDLIAVGADVEAQNKYGYTPLSVASKKGQMEIVQILLDAGADITAQNKNGTCALSEASKNGQIRTVKMLLLKGVRDSQKDAALEAAASSDTYGCKEIVEILVKAGASAKNTNALFKMNKGYNSDEKIVEQLLTAKADPNAKTEGGKTLLMNAAGAWGANPEILKKLLDAGADVNAKDDEGNTALIYTIKRYLNPKNVKVLLEAGADPNVTDNEGNTPLFLVMKANCAEYDKTESIRALIEKGATPDIANNDGITPLMSASRHNDEDIVRLLIPATTDINAKDKNGNTALYYAFNGKIAKLLTDAGADVNIENDDGKTALNEAAFKGEDDIVNIMIAAGASKQTKNKALYSAAKKGRHKIVNTLIAAGADVNAKDINGKTALWYAYTYDNDYTEDTMAVLMAAGADINIKDDKGNTMIMLSEEDYHSINLNKLQKLLDAGIDLNAKNNVGDTALITASGCNRDHDIAMVDMLLNYGAHVNDQNLNGDTALMLAVLYSGSSKTQKVKRLLAGGADVTIKNKDGATALMLAYDPEIVKILKNAGAKN